MQNMDNSTSYSSSSQNRKPFIVGLGGPSCTGKSTLAKRLAARLGGKTISMESYYNDLSHMPASERPKCNFDAPESLDAALLDRHVSEFAQGRDIEVPIYDFADHTRVSGRHELLKSAPLLIVEGILILYWPELRSNYDLKVYLEAPDDVCFQRRRVRDIVERQRSQEFIRQQYFGTVVPMARQFVYPTKHYADAVIDASREISAVETELTAKVTEAMRVKA